VLLFDSLGDVCHWQQHRVVAMVHVLVRVLSASVGCSLQADELLHQAADLKWCQGGCGCACNMMG